MRVLLTGFEPFDGYPVNPSQVLVETLAQEGTALLGEGIELKTLVLPVSFRHCLEPVEKEIETFQPEVVIAFGLAAGREAISIEKVAINWIDARIPDNEGAQPKECPVIEGGENALFTTLPAKSMIQGSLDVEVSATMSYTAGTFLCNYMMYRLLHLGREKEFSTGFIHLPCLTEGDEKSPGISQDELIRGGVAMIQALLTPSNKVNVEMGAIH